jgi:hypothetical protein
LPSIQTRDTTVSSIFELPNAPIFMPILYIYIIYQCKDSNIILLVKPEAMPKYGATVVHPAITSFNTGDAPAM